MELSSPQLVRYISCLIVGLSFQYKLLDIFPVEILFSKAFVFSRLRLVKFQEKNTNEKVQEEKASKKNEGYEIEDWTEVVVSGRSLFRLQKRWPII